MYEYQSIYCIHKNEFINGIYVCNNMEHIIMKHNVWINNIGRYIILYSHIRIMFNSILAITLI